MRFAKPTSSSYWLRLMGTALLVRLGVAFGLLGSMPLFADAAAYAQDAQALLEHFPGTEPYYLPPGLPYLLALAYTLFGDALSTARLVSIAISVLNVVMIAVLAHLVVRPRQAARAAGWLAALYLPDVMQNGQVYAQPLEMLCLLTMATCLIAGYRRRRWWLFGVAGAAFGLGSLARPSLLTLTLALLVTLALLLRAARRTRDDDAARCLLDGSLAFCVSVMLCVTPVLHYHVAQGVGPVLSVNNDRHFFLGNNPYTPHYKTSYLSSRADDQLDPEVRAYLQQFRERDDPYRAMQQEAWRYVFAHPFVTLLRTLNRIRAFWGFDYITSRRIQSYYHLGTTYLAGLLLLEAGGYLLTAALVLLGLFCAWPVLSKEKVWLLALVACYQLPYMAAFATGTYHFSVMGLLMPFAGAGLLIGKDRFSTRLDPRRRRRFYVALGCFCLIQLEYAWFTFVYSPAVLG